MEKSHNQRSSPPSKQPFTTTTTTTFAKTSASMDAKQIIDILPSYISLYKNSSSNPTRNPNPNPEKSAILKWFSALSPPQRLAHLTIVDPTFTQLLLRMRSHLFLSPHVTFFLLPDLPSEDSQPTICTRRSRGLLARVADSNESSRLLRSSILLFSSSECSGVSSGAETLDTVTFREGFVEEFDQFVRVMDRVSDSGFLNGSNSDWVELGNEWPELGWLKGKGYYSLEAFVANRVEVALRLAWVNGSGGKKRGMKLKEKANNAVGLGVNAYWRKKGCVDWWEKLDDGMKRKVFRMVLGKTAKSMTGEILKGADGSMENGLWNFGLAEEQSVRYRDQNAPTTEHLQRRAELGLTSDLVSPSSRPPTILRHVVNRLFVLQVIIEMALTCPHDNFNKEKIFFSSLESVNMIADGILSKLRGLLMAVSLDYIKFELMDEENHYIVANKSKEKQGGTQRKKKGKNRNSKKINPAIRNCDNAFVLDKTHEVKDQTSAPERSQTSPVKKGKQNKKKLRGKPDASSKVLNTSAETQTAFSSCTTTECEKEHISTDNAAGMKKLSNDTSISCLNGQQNLAPCYGKAGCTEVNLCSSERGDITSSVGDQHSPRIDCHLLSNKLKNAVVPNMETDHHLAESDMSPVELTTEFQSVHEANSDGDPVTVAAAEYQNNQIAQKDDDGHEDHASCSTNAMSSCGKTVDDKSKTNLIREQDNQSWYNGEAVIPAYYPSYEWPTVAPNRLAGFDSHHLPPATDRLHLEVGHNWQNHFQHSFIRQMHQTSSNIGGQMGRIMPQPLPASLDWSPVVQTCNYDSPFISRRQTGKQQSFAAQSPHKGALSSEEERKYFADYFDFSEPPSAQELADEYDSHWVSEEEYEVHAVSGKDYNQFFGGGVMYWNPSDYRGASFSRPPSLSSDDSSWAWREADMNRTVDDMVAFSSSYSTNGLNSPSAAPFCSPFESLPPGHQPIGYVRSGNEGKMVHSSSTMTDLELEDKIPGSLASISGDCDAKSGDSLPYPILRPIIIPSISRERSRSEFKCNRELRSPRVPPNRCEHPRIKRPPSPVVLCVPRAPRLPPPSPVGDSRKHRGFPTVRSGSSSPRHLGVRGWFHDGTNVEEACVRVDGAEVMWPSWKNKNFAARKMVQPLPGAILQDRLIAISQLTHDQEHPDVALPLQPPEFVNCSKQKASLPLMHNLLHEEIDYFCKQVATGNLIRRPYVNWAVKRVTRSLQVLWPRSRTNIFGSNATGLSLPTSDVDLVVCLPPVRNLEPIKEAGILEGRNSIKETCLQHAARYLGNQEWVKADSLKTVENTAIPIIMLVVDVPHDFVTATAAPTVHISLRGQNKLNDGRSVDKNDNIGSDSAPQPTHSKVINCDKDCISVRLDISFKSPSHTGLQTTELVKQLTDQFSAAIPLALVLKQFLADRSLDQSYSGGLSSYCLVLLITRFLQHEHHHCRPINQNLGSLFMDFLYFFGNVFDPRQMRVSIQGSGLYINRERGCSIDPIYIDDPLFPTNNVGKNCFRIHQCIKAFADAYATLENELTCLLAEGDANTTQQYRLLPKVIPSISLP
ncbi:uncharacterized protein LOC110721453 [Chenopodium quinoa]|uniref:uncharacterized protein LOC110721453 n=1 Tax=Chenopodium quinoa TaxID=63459 RepID=UPI000B78E1AF|nr:uncharacterized protein LOC110721453 [Chenopodium quinoa]XP_021756294.1 uncharacterized protein LOC110721453 [Chenopodium quinoa]XP_021756295.1 uncharacterized protein LOC110721453 [Chenopodium quinoa]XP_021756296.1 uncharacterized protein LOC110721453 [Chenopodium quinoa]